MEERAIQEALDKVIALLQEEESIKQYKHLKYRIDHFDDIQDKVKTLTYAQKERAQSMYYNKPKSTDEWESIAKEMDDTLHNDPLVQQYQACLVEADDLLQYIVNTIQTAMNQEGE